MKKNKLIFIIAFVVIIAIGTIGIIYYNSTKNTALNNDQQGKNAQQFEAEAKSIFTSYIANKENQRKNNITLIEDKNLVSSSADGYGRYLYTFNVKCFTTKSNIATEIKFKVLLIPLYGSEIYSEVGNVILQSHFGEPLSQQDKDELFIRKKFKDATILPDTIDVSDSSNYKIIIGNITILFGNSNNLSEKIIKAINIYNNEFMNYNNEKFEIILTDVEKPIVRDYQ